MSVSLIHPILKLDPYRFVIDYALGSRGSANNGSPGDMAIVHGPSWSEGVIERKFRDHSSVIRCVSWSMVHMPLCLWSSRDIRLEITACKERVITKGSLS